MDTYSHVMEGMGGDTVGGLDATFGKKSLHRAGPPLSTQECSVDEVISGLRERSALGRSFVGDPQGGTGALLFLEAQLEHVEVGDNHLPEQEHGEGVAGQPLPEIPLYAEISRVVQGRVPAPGYQCRRQASAALPQAACR